MSSGSAMSSCFNFIDSCSVILEISFTITSKGLYSSTYWYKVLPSFTNFNLVAAFNSKNLLIVFLASSALKPVFTVKVPAKILIDLSS